ncbi:hypothetical protein AB0L64_20265 [Kribbella sp. NPDC051936]|uniref:hypothetical protein n=1 Tax=Kribbella sp. NPDC051936 TaxID=3154946 RepID=UPI0034347EC7
MTLDSVTFSRVTLGRVAFSRVTLGRFTFSRVALSRDTLSSTTPGRISLGRVALGSVTLSHMPLSRMTLGNSAVSRIVLSSRNGATISRAIARRIRLVDDRALAGGISWLISSAVPSSAALDITVFSRPALPSGSVIR